MIFFLFCHVVITLFTFRTCQCDFYAHDFHLHCVFAFSVIADVCGGLFLCGRQRSYPLFLCIKKRPSSMSLFDYITISLPRQGFFEGGRPGSGGSGRLWAGFADSLLTPALGHPGYGVRPGALLFWLRLGFDRSDTIPWMSAGSRKKLNSANPPSPPAPAASRPVSWWCGWSEGCRPGRSSTWLIE